MADYRRTGYVRGELRFSDRRQKPASKTPHVVIDSFRGNASITGADADTVKVTGHRSDSQSDQKGADPANREMPFEIDGDPNTITLRNNQDRLSANTCGFRRTWILRSPGRLHRSARPLRRFRYHGYRRRGRDRFRQRRRAVAEHRRGRALDLRRSDVVRAVGVKGLFDMKGRGEDVDLQNMEGQVTITGSYRRDSVSRSGQAAAVYGRADAVEHRKAAWPGAHGGPGEFSASNLVCDPFIFRRAHAMWR